MKQTITILQQKSDWKRQVQFMRLVIGVYETKQEAIDFATNYPNGTHIEIWENWESSVIVK